MKSDLFTVLHKSPPSDTDAEMACLCSIMFDRRQISQVCDMITKADFFDCVHAEIFAAIINTWAEEDDCTIDLVVSNLKSSAVWNDTYFESLAKIKEHDDGTYTHALYFAVKIRDASLRRRLGIVIEDTIHDVIDDSKTSDEVVNKALHKIYELEAIKKNQERFSTAGLIQEFLASIDNKDRDEVPTGFGRIDSLLAGGLRPGNLALLAARPSIGKSSLALDVATHAAKLTNKAIAFFSLEMSSGDIASRMVSKSSGVPLQHIRNRSLSNEQLQRINECTEQVESLNIETFTGDQTMMSILQKCRTVGTTEGLILVVVDYLTLVTPNRQSGKSREQEVSEISRFLKGMANRLNVPVLACCQLNREVEKTQRPPRLSDLRESGALEQDADVVFMLHKTRREDLSAIVGIAKHRNGPLGHATLDWLPDTCTFTDQITKERNSDF